jgi:plastocyanin
MVTAMRMTFVVMSLIAAMACGSSSSSTSPTPTTMSAAIVSSGFTPNPISISTGSTVTWTNNDNAPHGIVDDGVFNSGTIAPGATYSYMFPSAGTFTYHDASNPNVVGTVNVSGSSSPSPY